MCCLCVPVSMSVCVCVCVIWAELCSKREKQLSLPVAHTLSYNADFPPNMDSTSFRWPPVDVPVFPNLRTRSADFVTSLWRLHVSTSARQHVSTLRGSNGGRNNRHNRLRTGRTTAASLSRCPST